MQGPERWALGVFWGWLPEHFHRLLKTSSPFSLLHTRHFSHPALPLAMLLGRP